jgi:17beta-estradiol 17-dehydrogenase / very-long-chain 3-oxoacyl-CoA reductase
MDKLGRFTNSYGVNIYADSSIVQAALYSLLLTGIVAVALPIISTVRVLLSLFVLPGESVGLIIAHFFSLALTKLPAH